MLAEWAFCGVSPLCLPEDPSCPCTITKPFSPSNGNFGISEPGLCLFPPKVNLDRRAELVLVKSAWSTDSGLAINEVADLCLFSEQDRERRHAIGLADRVR